jgi:hypothetical protein
MAKSLLTKLGDAKKGAVLPRTLETPEAFVAVHLLERDAQGVEVETATFGKADFGSYLMRAAASVPIDVQDRALTKALVSKVPWARELRFVSPL